MRLGISLSRFGSWVLIGLTLLVSCPLWAHEIRPALADLSFDGSGGFSVAIDLNLEVLLAEIDPQQHDNTGDAPGAKRYEALRGLEAAQLAERFEAFRETFVSGIDVRIDNQPTTLAVDEVDIPDVGDTAISRQSKVSLSGTVAPGSHSMTWRWAPEFGAIALRASSPEQMDFFTAYLKGGSQSDDIAVSGLQQPQSGFQVFLDYVVVGFDHILPKGLDHILFVIGLFLLSVQFKTLLWQVTSFTLAHSVTLALGLFGVINISPEIVEPLIAASIVYVCAENVFLSHLSRIRPFMIFGFGLLHGLGFASVLTEFGLSSNHFVSGLVGFNVGVEVGQLTVIALCFLAVGFWFGKKPWYRRVITIPASLVIALIGCYWVVERTGMI